MKTSQRKLLLDIGIRHGFHVEKRALLRPLIGGLELRLSRDAGGNAKAVGLQIDIELTDRTLRFPILWQNICPGFQYYRIYRTPAACAAAIRANVAIAIAFCESIELHGN